MTDRRSGVLRAEFEEDIAATREFAKPLLLEFLSQNGATIDEFYDWDVVVSGKRLEMRGELNQSGTRRILSLLDAPPSLQQSAQDAAASGDESQLELLTSKSYFRTIVSLLEDLRGAKRRRQTMGQIGVWFQNYARRIEQLPILNVHPDLLDFGWFVSSSLREGRLVIQGAGARSASRPRGARQERVRGTLSASALVQELEVAAAEMRRHMTRTFNVEF